MKLKHFILNLSVVALLILNYSCNSGDSVVGDGNKITSVKELDAFNAINIKGVFTVNLIESKSNGVEIIGDSNIVANVKASVNDKTLTLGFDKEFSFSNFKSLIVNISVNNLKELNISNVGITKSKNLLVCKNLNIINSSVGKVELNIEATKVNIENSAVGNLILSGSVNNLELINSAVGNVEAFELSVKSANITHSGVGNVNVNVSKKINVESDAVGNVTYKGNPAKTKHHATSVGDIKAI